MFDNDERVFTPKGNWVKMMPIRLINDIRLFQVKTRKTRRLLTAL